MKFRRLAICIMVSTIMAMSALPSIANDNYDSYPERTVRVIVPFGPGGSGDLTTRALLQFVDLGKPTVVINMPGAGSTIGTMEVFHSKPDGYTLLANSPAGMIVGGLKGLYPEAVFRDMIPIVIMGMDNPVFCVARNSPFKTAQEFFSYAKENPGKLKLASVGMSTMYTSGLVVKDAAGIDIKYVAFDSSTKSRAALLGGHVDSLLATISENKSLIEAGDLRPLFVLSEEKSPFLPDVPTLIDLGYNVTGCLGTRGIWAPASTPRPIIDKLEAAFMKAAQNKGFQDVFRQGMSIDPVAWNSAATKAWIEKNSPYYGMLLEKYGKK
ncbi:MULTISPECIES: Bug family tripartite tricarboxylate transporter substrate binding protein [Dethiosulfovibrio]|uniref:Tripartite tricarboxylate transporter substrate binding protein n=2 Tax=Dethiosulfovibrio TaxID=47054 RepID=A0ABS9EM23_9BACT|nr:MULTISPECIES: tripartite tricarboxylate transporter substrate binding protein [Dethiosulfovibrio]MCF4113189.1 tripartite tricarboxylate transporter substrate binding protein [Dethiosulfovibrio russensis]MCF4142253.1 tripartite tricarboxylate transporter substrate binding protein [Dethiosulfovibrio marinus]MCF4144561.1 tripartite tricarboxylate transporter substrate binding protein [Dethiosulfovibrio acidaminovorans]